MRKEIDRDFEAWWDKKMGDRMRGSKYLARNAWAAGRISALQWALGIVKGVRQGESVSDKMKAGESRRARWSLITDIGEN